MIITKLYAVTTSVDIPTTNGVLSQKLVHCGGIKASNIEQAKEILKKNSKITVFRPVINFQSGIVYEYGLLAYSDVPTKTLSLTFDVYDTSLGAKLVKPKENKPLQLYSYKIQKIADVIPYRDYFQSDKRWFTTGLYLPTGAGTFYQVRRSDDKVLAYLKNTSAVSYEQTWSDFTADITSVTIQQPLTVIREGVEVVQNKIETVTEGIKTASTTGLWLAGAVVLWKIFK